MPLNPRTRRLANLVNLSTPLGLLVARAGRARVVEGPDGLRLASGYRLGFPVAVAFTIGDVLISRHEWGDLQLRRPGLLDHEAAHSDQYAWCGPAFLPAYVLATAWSWLRTGDRAAANLFERRAGLERGGYAVPPAPGESGDALRSPRRWGLTFVPTFVRRIRRSGRSRAAGPTGSAAGSRGGDGAA